MRRQIACASCAQFGKQVPSKYKCPACEIGSCSLACVNHHKTTTNCTGVRNRAAAVRKSDYDENVFMNDYTLLEDAARQLRAANRLRRQVMSNDCHSVTPNYSQHSSTNATNKGRMTLLAREAAARNTDLRFLPAVYSRHRRNTTYAKRSHNSDQRTLFWSLDVHADVDGDIRQLRVKSCCENETVGSIIGTAISSLKSKRRGLQVEHHDLFDAAIEDMAIFLRNETVLAAQSDVVHLPAFRRHFGLGGTRGAPIRQKLVASSDDTGKDTGSTTSKIGYCLNQVDVRKFVPIVSSTTLRKALEEQCVVEFPVMHVALKGSRAAKKMEVECRGIFERPEALAASSDDDAPVDDDDDDDSDDDDGDDVDVDVDDGDVDGDDGSDENGDGEGNGNENGNADDGVEEDGKEKQSDGKGSSVEAETSEISAGPYAEVQKNLEKRMFTGQDDERDR